MGTREVYEEKLRSGAHLHRDPTINPGLGSPRCPRCLSLLNPTAVRLIPSPLPLPIPPRRSFAAFLLTPFFCSAAQGEGDWAITSVLHDATAVVTTRSLSRSLDAAGLDRGHAALSSVWLWCYCSGKFVADLFMIFVVLVVVLL
jgi:hypothetical protein